MSKNETSSDKIKQLLAEQGHGDEKDWKRLPKKKNEDGLWLRSFENRGTGARLDVLELADGRFEITPLTAAANGAFAKPAAQGGTALETDPAKNKAADQVMASDFEDVDEKLLKKAGKALANRFTFAVTNKDAEDMEANFYAIITPTKYWKEEGCCYDQPSPIWHLLNGEDVNDCGTWVFEKEYNSAGDLARDLQKKGFIWDRGFQDFIDKNFTAGLAPAAQGDKPTAPAPKPPVL